MGIQNVGMIGLGLMGTALSERLLDAGHAVWVQNRTREKADPLAARGTPWAENPLDVCDRVLISRYTTDTVEVVLAQLDGGLRLGQILIDTKTVAPELTARLGTRPAARGVHYLDPPISGSSVQTRRVDGHRRWATGSLCRLPRPVRLLRPADDLRQALRQWLADEAGQQPRAGAEPRALAEGLVFARTLGIDPEAPLQVLIGSIAYSRTMDTKGRQHRHYSRVPTPRRSAMTDPNRRSFLKQTAAASAAAAWACTGDLYAAGANERVTVGIVGCGGRGAGLAEEFAGLANVAYVCDPDESRRRQIQDKIALSTRSPICGASWTTQRWTPW